MYEMRLHESNQNFEHGSKMATEFQYQLCAVVTFLSGVKAVLWKYRLSQIYVSNPMQWYF